MFSEGKPIVEIILTAEQARQITDPRPTIVLRGPDGTLLGYFSLEYTEFVDEILARQKTVRKCYTTAEVLAFLRSKESE